MIIPGEVTAARPLAVVLSIAVLSLAGCAHKAAPAPVPPPMRAEVGYTLGSPVDPPAPAGAAAGEPMVLRLRGYAAAPSAAAPGESLAARGGLVISSANEPLATAPPGVESVRLVKDLARVPSPAGRGAVLVAEGTAPLPAGCTATMSFFADTGKTGAGGGPILRVGVISPSAAGGDRPRLVVSAAGVLPPERSPEAGGAEPGDQSLLIDWPLPTPTGEFALYFPADLRRGLRLPTVWRIELATSDEPEAVQASAAVLTRLTTSPKSTRPGRAQLLGAALAPSAATADLRQTLLAVSAEAQAAVTSEAALLLDDKALSASAAQISEALVAAPAGSDAVQIGWLADKALLAGLAKLAAGGEFPPAVGAMLSARFGEAGRDPAALGELATASASRADFETRVRAENLILLDDASPASRVRAYEWMAGRSEAPAGYDPLGPSAQRRAAVDQYLQSLTRQPETNPTTQANPTTHPSSQPLR